MKKAYSPERERGSPSAESRQPDDERQLFLCQSRNTDIPSPINERIELSSSFTHSEQQREERFPLIQSGDRAASEPGEYLDEFVENSWSPAVKTTGKEEDSGNSSMSGAGSVDGDSVGARTRSSSSDSKSEADAELSKVFERREKLDPLKGAECDDYCREKVYCDNRNETISFDVDGGDGAVNEQSATQARCYNRALDMDSTAGLIKPSSSSPFATPDTQNTGDISKIHGHNVNSPTKVDGIISPRLSSPVNEAHNITLNPQDLNVSWGARTTPMSPPTQTLPQASFSETSSGQNIPFTSNQHLPNPTSNASILHNNTGIACTSFSNAPFVPLYINSHQHNPSSRTTSSQSSSPPSLSSTSAQQPIQPQNSQNGALLTSPLPIPVQHSGIQFQPENFQGQNHQNSLNNCPPLNNASNKNLVTGNTWAASNAPETRNSQTNNNNTTGMSPPPYYHHLVYPSYYAHNINVANGQPLPPYQNYNINNNTLPSSWPQTTQLPHHPYQTPSIASSDAPRTSGSALPPYPAFPFMGANYGKNPNNPQQTAQQNPVVMVPVHKHSTTLAGQFTSEDFSKYPQGQFYLNPYHQQQYMQQPLPNWVFANDPIFQTNNTPLPTLHSSQNPNTRIENSDATTTSSAIPPLSQNTSSLQSSQPSQNLPQQLQQHPHLSQLQGAPTPEYTRQLVHPFYLLPPQMQHSPQLTFDPYSSAMPLLPFSQNTRDHDGQDLSVVQENPEEATTESQDDSTATLRDVSQRPGEPSNGDNTSVSMTGDVPDADDTHPREITGLKNFLPNRQIECNTQHEPANSLSVSGNSDFVQLSHCSGNYLVSKRSTPDYTSLCVAATFLNPLIGLFALLANRTAKQKYRRRQGNAANNCYLFAILLSAISFFTTVTIVFTVVVHFTMTPGIQAPAIRKPGDAIDIVHCRSSFTGFDEDLQRFYNISDHLYCRIHRMDKLMYAMDSYIKLNNAVYVHHTRNKSRESTTEQSISSTATSPTVPKFQFVLPLNSSLDADGDEKEALSESLEPCNGECGNNVTKQDGGDAYEDVQYADVIPSLSSHNESETAMTTQMVNDVSSHNDSKTAMTTQMVNDVSSHNESETAMTTQMVNDVSSHNESETAMTTQMVNDVSSHNESETAMTTQFVNVDVNTTNTSSGMP